MVAQRNPDIDPTRLQPYGNPHARTVGPGVYETEQVQDIRKEAAEAMAGEGDSAEEAKSKGGRGRRSVAVPKGMKRLHSNNPREYVDKDSGDGKIYDESGRQLAVLASPAGDEIGMPVRIVKDDTPNRPIKVNVESHPEQTNIGGTDLETSKAMTPDDDDEDKPDTAYLSDAPADK